MHITSNPINTTGYKINLMKMDLFGKVARPDHRAERENREKLKHCDASRSRKTDL